MKNQTTPFLKVALVAVASLVLVQTSRATSDGTNTSPSVVYVSAAAGNDVTGTGTIDLPYKTVAKAMTVVQSGDTCILRGGVYRELVVPEVNNLTIAGYPGESAIISGCDLVTSSWSATAGKPGVMQTAVTSAVSQLFINGARMNLASYPDQPAEQDMLSYASWTPTTTVNSIAGEGLVTFSSLPNQPANYWVGGTYTGRNGPNPFTATRGEIISSTDNTITCHNLNYNWRINSTPNSYLGSGSGYIINCLNALDAPTEWYWGEHTLYVQAPKGTSLTQSVVEARTRLWGLNLSNRTSIVVKGLTFNAASLNLAGAINCRISNCTVLYPAPWTKYDTPTPSDYLFKLSEAGQQNGMDYGGPDDGSCGVFVSGSGNRISQCYIAHSWGGALRLDGTNNLIEDSRMEDLGWLGRRISGVQLLGEGNQVLRCIIRRTAQAGIDGGNRSKGFGKVGYHLVAASNLITDIGLLTSDTGGFYINNQGSPTPVNAVLAYNTIIATKVIASNVSGIYIDNSTSGVLAHHNVVVVSPIAYHGINMNNIKACSDIQLYNNTVIGGTKESINIKRTKTNIVFKNNLATGTISGATTESNNLASQSDASHFVNPAVLDFQLLPNSPAVDAGAIIPGITDGYVGSAPDVGAYEWGAATTFPPPYR